MTFSSMRFEKAVAAAFEKWPRPEDLTGVLAFYAEHVLCVAALDGGVDDAGSGRWLVWMACRRCNARI